VADIQGAKGAGIRTILVHSTKGPSEFADHTCENLIQIMEIIQ